MEKKENVEEGVSEKPEEKKSAAYYEKRPEFGNRGPSKILLHFRKGLTFFLVIAACVIFYFLLLRIDDISVGVSKVIDVKADPIRNGDRIFAESDRKAD